MTGLEVGVEEDEDELEGGLGVVTVICRLVEEAKPPSSSTVSLTVNVPTVAKV